MVDYGHFRELGLILERVNGNRSGNGSQQDHGQHVPSRQTLVYSATLTLPHWSGGRKGLKSRQRNVSGAETVGMEIITPLKKN